MKAEQMRLLLFFYDLFCILLNFYENIIMTFFLFQILVTFA